MRDQRNCKLKVLQTLTAAIFPPTGTVESSYSGYRPTGNFDTELRYFIELSGTRASYAQMIRSLTQSMEASLRQQYPNNASEVHNTMRLITNVLPTLDEMINRVIPIYRKYFNVSEIQQINKMYSTPVMRNMVSKQPLLMQHIGPLFVEIQREMNERIAERFGIPHGQQ